MKEKKPTSHDSWEWDPERRKREQEIQSIANTIIDIVINKIEIDGKINRTQYRKGVSAIASAMRQFVSSHQ